MTPDTVKTVLAFFTGSLEADLLRLWSIRWDFNSTYSIKSEAGRLRFFLWWLVDGTQQHPNLVTAETKDAFKALSLRPDNSAGSPLSTLESIYRLTQPQVLYYFTEQDFEIYRCWFHSQALKHSPLMMVPEVSFSPQLIVRAEEEYESLNTAIKAARHQFYNPFSVQTPFDQSIGVVGYARSELGIGEDVRTTALSLLTQNFQVKAFETSTGNRHNDSDRRIEPLLSKIVSSKISILNLSPIDTIVFWSKVGEDFFAGRYTIGFWPWELSEWPLEWNDALNLVEEIWTISDHAAQSIRTATSKPVIVMPIGVEVQGAQPRARQQFGLPEDRFMFFFAFDANSFSARKNPQGLVKAFKMAFGRRNDVGLVIKISNFDQQRHPDLALLLAETQGVYIVNQTLNRVEHLTLMNSCDAVVSLHRAEGFGRIMAEAMLLEKPVIATGYSGNLEFCKAENSQLVDFSLRPIESGEYHFSEGFHWAEPSLEHASELMLKLANCGPNLGQTERARQLIEATYSLKVCGQRYKARIDQIRS